MTTAPPTDLDYLLQADDPALASSYAPVNHALSAAHQLIDDGLHVHYSSDGQGTCLSGHCPDALPGQ